MTAIATHLDNFVTVVASATPDTAGHFGKSFRHAPDPRSVAELFNLPRASQRLFVVLPGSIEVIAGRQSQETEWGEVAVTVEVAVLYQLGRATAWSLSKVLAEDQLRLTYLLTRLSGRSSGMQLRHLQDVRVEEPEGGGDQRALVLEFRFTYRPDFSGG